MFHCIFLIALFIYLQSLVHTVISSILIKYKSFTHSWVSKSNDLYTIIWFQVTIPI